MTNGPANAAGGDAHEAPRRWIRWAAFGLLAVLYLSRLSGYALQDPDEGRYAEIPREMIESGDWVTPRLNYVKYFEKPPLLYWSVAVAFEAFGQSEQVARLTPAIAALGCVWLTYLLGSWLVNRRTGFLGAAILATTPLFFAFSQALVIDMILTTAMTATLAAFYRLCLSDRKTPWAVATAALAAVAVLAKGPVGLVLPGAIALAVLAWRRDGASTRALLDWRPIALFVAAVVPWFVVVAQRNPEFLQFFFVHEHLERFAGDVGHPDTALYYVPVVLLGALPWSLVALGLLPSSSNRQAFGRIPRDARVFFGVWAVLVLAFFTAASSKLPGYVLPAFPPLALLAGAWIDEMVGETPLVRILDRVTMGLVVVALLYVLVASSGFAATEAIAQRLRIQPGHVLEIATALAQAGAAILLVTVAREIFVRLRGPRTAVSFATIVVALALSLWAAVGGRGAAKTSRDLADAAHDALAGGARIVAYRQLMQGLPFYTGRRIVQVDARGELWHGAEHAADEKQFFWDDLTALSRAWEAGPIVIATSGAYLDELERGLDPAPVILARDGDRYLLGRRPEMALARPIGADPVR